ncbi:helix-turn-helix domain-containing protein [Rheinheimera sp.]|uniref:helix-turn-helix domain-containing protein n=1 Tax=Rheinheimera sp. TaxID=1869214 RepID=UPI00307FCE63
MAESKDWHTAEIVSQLKIKTGKSLRQLSAENNLAETTLSQALQRPYPRAEKIIAEAIGVQPQIIWPSRYNSDGSSSRRKGKRSITKNCPADTSKKSAGGEND